MSQYGARAVAGRSSSKELDHFEELAKCGPSSVNLIAVSDRQEDGKLI